MTNVFDYIFNIGGNFSAQISGMSAAVGNFSASVEGADSGVRKFTGALAGWKIFRSARRSHFLSTGTDTPALCRW